MILKTLNGTKGAYGYGDYSAYLPRGKRPGKWLPPETPILCQSGYHTTDETNLVLHLGEYIYEVEVRGECATGTDKEAHEQIRLVRRLYTETWTPRNQRLFAVDCARVAVNLYAAESWPELLHACLDTVVGSIEGFCDSEAAYAARAAAYAAANASYAAYAACTAAYAADAADAVRTQQAELLSRYLSGEQGPFVEREDA